MNYFKESIKSGLNEYDLILKKSLDSLSDEELTWKPNPHSNNIIFLLWHMILVEDNLINTVLLQNEKMWIQDKYYKDFPHLKNEIGFAFSQNELDNFPEMKLSWLMNYYNSLRKITNKFLEESNDETLAKSYMFGKRKVTGFFIVGRLVTELSQHLGQISYIRGMIRGLNK